MSSIDAPGTLRQIERRAVLIQSAIAILLCSILLYWIAGAWWRSQQPRIDWITLSNVQPIGSSSLCPGDTLRISYHVAVAGAGVLDRDATTWALSPPFTIVSTEPKRLAVDGPVDQPVEEAWVIPDVYVNPRTGITEPVAAGNYRRVLALTSREGESVSAIGSVSFSIRTDCTTGD